MSLKETIMLNHVGNGENKEGSGLNEERFSLEAKAQTGLCNGCVPEWSLLKTWPSFQTPSTFLSGSPGLTSLSIFRSNPLLSLGSLFQDCVIFRPAVPFCPGGAGVGVDGGQCVWRQCSQGEHGLW